MSDMAEIWELGLVCLPLSNRPTLVSTEQLYFGFNTTLTGGNWQK